MEKKEELRTKNTITLGSGKLYVAEFAKGTDIYKIENKDVETEDNHIGWIKGGAALTYTPEFFETTDDLGMVVKRFLQSEEAAIKSGIMTWNGETISKLISTGKTEEKGNVRITKIGGIGNYDNKLYLVRFLHEDAVDGNMRVTIVGQNTSGLELTYAKDNETVIDAEFKATPLDNSGTLIIIEEEISRESTPGSESNGDGTDNSTSEAGTEGAEV